MATLSTIESSYQNPNVQNFLKIIANAEGVKYGYNTLFGNTYIQSLAAHPNTLVPFKDKTGKTDYSTAAGAYQFLYGTWERLRKTFGFTNFGGRNQDLAAIALISEKGALSDVETGNYASAIKKLGGVWASLPSSQYKSTQPSKSWEEIGVAETETETPTGFKKWIMQTPAFKILLGGAGAANTVTNHPDGVLAGASQAAGDIGGMAQAYSSNIVEGAGNFALRAVVILAAIALVILGFYFMFKQEIAGAVKAVV